MIIVRGCCDDCGGCGAGGLASSAETNGLCSSCYGTGHLHDKSKPCPNPARSLQVLEDHLDDVERGQ